MKRRRFKQLTRTDRLNIEKYMRQGMTKQAIADALGVSLRTVYYELKRGQYVHTNSDLTEEIRYSCDVAEAVKKYNALSTITVVSAVVFLVLSAWAAFQFEWGWGMHIAPTAAFAAVALVVMLVAFVYMERMKKQHDLVTYREVLAFSRGEQVDRDTLEGRREREMNPWVKGTRNAVQIIISAIAGGLVGVGIGMLAKMLS